MSEIKNDLKESANHHRENAVSKTDFFWRMFYEVMGLLIGKIYWTLHARAPVPFGLEGLCHLLVLLRWSWPIWLTSAICWYFFGFDFWPTVIITTVAVWLFSRFQPYTY